MVSHINRHRDAKRDLGIELQRIGKQHKFPDVEVCVKQLVLAGSAGIRAALQARMLREQLDEETMDEEEVETLMLDIERWAEKSKMSGYAQPASHETPPGRQDSGGGAKGGGKGDRGNVRPGQQCRFGASCGDPACWSKMTHKDRQRGNADSVQIPRWVQGPRERDVQEVAPEEEKLWRQ